jgi:F-type H+-transporting ATPase subunit b
MKWAVLLSLFSAVAQAAETEPEVGGVPPVVFFQALNLAVLAGILIYFLKDKVREHFKNKRESYLKASREVAELKRQVEEQARALREKIRKLDETAEQSQRQAEADALEYNKKLLAEAKEQADKLIRENEKTISAEIYKTMDALRAELVDHSIGASRELIQKEIKESDQKRLQDEFVRKIGVVQP